MAKQIVIEHLFKVFGDAPERALDLARQGVAKQDIVAQTGQSIGVFDASFTIEPGEIFVVMGLSGSGKSTLVRMFLLMDEAFSALDPIIRTELQDELLRLQQVKRRTIVFISHDLDEAMRIGDRVAIMKDGQVVQVGTPEEILRQPADDYVRQFVRGVDQAAVFKAGDIARKTQVEVSESPTRGCRPALKRLQDQDREWAYVVDPRHRYLGAVSADSLRKALHGHEGPLGLTHAFVPDVQPVPADTPITELYRLMVAQPAPLPVVAEDGRFVGTVSKNRLLTFLDPYTDADGNPLPEAAVAAEAA